MKPRLVVRAASFPGDHAAEAFIHTGPDMGEIVEMSPEEALKHGRALVNIGLLELHRKGRQDG